MPTPAARPPARPSDPSAKPTRSGARSATRKRPAGKASPPPLTATNADRYDLYQQSVQSVEAEIDFVDRTFKKLRRRVASRFREDFCGTALSACEWVRRRPTNTALGVDLDPKPLAWGILNTLSELTQEQRDRVTLENGDVMKVQHEPGEAPDIVNAMNFSYFCLMDRATLLAYFRSVRAALAPDGIFFLDHYGGSDTLRETREQRRVGRGVRSFTYIWDQFSFDPISGRAVNYIHFHFNDGTQLHRAFRYEWRIWGLAEVQDVLRDAGFARVSVYWEDDDGTGKGSGTFRRRTRGDADFAHINYIVAEK